MDKYIKYNYTNKLIISLIMLLLILTFSFIPLFNSKVYAEEIVIYNFNQLYDYSKFTGNSLLQKIGNGHYLINETVAGGVNWVYLSLDYNNRFTDHKLFLTVGYRHDNYPYPTIGFGNDIGSQWIYGSGIIDGTNEFTAFFRIDNGTYNNVVLTPMIIDLTQMFGSGNEPTLDECYSLFPTYYNYTDNISISNNNFESYNNGYKDALNSFDYKLNTSQTYNSFESGNTIEYPAASIIGYATPTPLIYPVYKPTNPEYILQPTYYQVRVNKYGRLRLGTEIDKGASVNIKGMVSGEYNTGLTTTSKINICILDYQNNLVVLKTIDLPTYTGNKQINYINFEVNFTLSGNTESLYFTCDNLSTNTNNTYFYLGDIEISTKILNTSQLIENSYNTGYDTGYNNGYDIGYNNGINTKGESVWQNSMAFIKNIFVNIFDIFSIEILPNVSLGTFIIIPLIFSILFFIVKIAKGG